MSRKSRQPDDADAVEAGGKAAKGKKGKKGKKGAKGVELPEGARRQLVVESKPAGVPFAIVVLAAAAMTLPSATSYLEGSMPFDALMMRVFGALAVSYLLCNLVYAVFESMRPAEVHAVVELPAEKAFEQIARQDGALTGTIVGGEDLVGDPFALDPVAPVEVAPLAVESADEEDESAA